MKKVFGILVIAIAMCCAQTASAQKSATFNLKMNVSNYIEAMCGPVDFNFGTTQHQSAGYEGLVGNTGSWNLAYANCPFSITISGSNGAGQGVPRFARQETGTHGGAWDFLPTAFDIKIGTNGVNSSFNGLVAPGTETFVPLPLGANSFPKTQTYVEAPHNGQVHMEMTAYVNEYAAGGALFDNVPLRRTQINPNWTNEKSADAGEYTCTMVVTLAAI